ncbi:MAG: alpha-galactosidase [Candidatus Bipolaricaulia bacterium]
MLKITFIGAGSVVFTRNLTSVKATLDRREAIRDADFVIVTIQVGGLEAYELDIEIPLKYGVGQCVGDTLGPGGVFRGLRTIPVLQEITREMDGLCRPEALLINYSNPMSINCWAITADSGRPHVGLCHSVQGTSEMLARWIGAPYDEVTYKVAGINHQAWFLEFKWNGEDVYPMLRKAMEDPKRQGEEPIRIELARQFGYFVTESSGHASEYTPYFRKSAEMIDNEIVPRFQSSNDAWFDWGCTGGYLRTCQRELPTYLDEVKEQIAGRQPLPTGRTHEYGSYIIEAMATHQPTVIYGNVPNTGLITNLPEGCCVEGPCLVDGNGIRPCYVGELPWQLAGLNRNMINVQGLAVNGSLTGDREAIVHAVMLDPLTAAVCTLPQIRAMVDEMFEVQAQWLPQF